MVPGLRPFHFLDFCLLPVFCGTLRSHMSCPGFLRLPSRAREFRYADPVSLLWFTGRLVNQTCCDHVGP